MISQSPPFSFFLFVDLLLTHRSLDLRIFVDYYLKLDNQLPTDTLEEGLKELL